MHPVARGVAASVAFFNPTARPGDHDWRVLYMECGDGASGESKIVEIRSNPLNNRLIVNSVGLTTWETVYGIGDCGDGRGMVGFVGPRQAKIRRSCDGDVTARDRASRDSARRTC
jgi:hypothetical protein